MSLLARCRPLGLALLVALAAPGCAQEMEHGDATDASAPAASDAGRDDLGDGGPGDAGLGDGGPGDAGLGDGGLGDAGPGDGA